MTIKHVQTISTGKASGRFDRSLFENISWFNTSFHSHKEIATSLQDKNPYTITIVIESLRWDLRNKKEYVKKTRTPIVNKYKELLYELFFEEHGQNGGNDLYAKWLEQYRSSWQQDKKYESVDDYIIERELESRYKNIILARFKNHEKLFTPRMDTSRERYYRLPEPFTWVDWRNPYDTIFVWEENGRRVARRGGSGSSGARETNSMFIFGLLKLNKTQPVPSYLFLYSDINTLLFIKKFDRLCIPARDIGANYDIGALEEKRLKKEALFLKWDFAGKIKSIDIYEQK
ncbi:hypothetical protein HY947_02275 [Candidatus Gottesmanbacteria bacterium]|nr:hypothetical protein [Candidatus Gottesmanbacteria bacterium]